MNTGKCLLLSTGIVALSTGWTAAAPAVAGDFRLRSGPGFNGVIGYVDSGHLDLSASSPITYAVASYHWPYGAYRSAFESYWRNPYGYYYRLNLLCALPPTRQECIAARPPIR